jgi:membrane dipeptidase
MSDDMIKALAKNGGVIQINFGSMFIDDEIRKIRSAGYEELKKELDAKGLDFGEPEAKKIVEDYRKAHPSGYATIQQVADHIDHVVKLVGADHVGFGSDFDGVGDSLPTDLKDVSEYPNLIRVLLERGYSDEDIKKIASGNVLRVWQAVENHAAEMATASAPTPKTPTGTEAAAPAQ